MWLQNKTAEYWRRNGRPDISAIQLRANVETLKQSTCWAGSYMAESAFRRTTRKLQNGLGNPRHRALRMRNFPSVTFMNTAMVFHAIITSVFLLLGRCQPGTRNRGKQSCLNVRTWTGVKKNLDEAEALVSRRSRALRSSGTVQSGVALFSRPATTLRQRCGFVRRPARRSTAQENLAWMYYTGAGIALDYSEAAKWVRLAAEQGHARPQLDLAYLYEQGKGVPLDYSNAYVWYTAAAIGGERRASKRIKSVERVMTPDQINKARAAAEQLSKSLPKSSMRPAQTRLQIRLPTRNSATANAKVLAESPATLDVILKVLVYARDPRKPKFRMRRRLQGSRCA